MITLHQLGAMMATSFVILIIPGPSVLFIVSRGVAMGRRAALATVAGNSLGASCHAVAAALGVGAIVARSVVLFNVMKVVGAAYLVLLGVRAIRNRRHLADALALGAQAHDRRRLMREGFIVGISNPKVPLFFLAILPQFVEPDHRHVWAQMLIFGLVFVTMATISDGLYGILAGSVRNWFAGSPRRSAMVGGASGLALIGLGVRVAFTGRHD
ncbi:MAG: LysE family translocator [Acidimicrobiia bacterium]